ncbi:hypothetical protein [Pseudofrankia asymbiotica]|uniref:Uncharacterized protein n=1 Tax=Pseudofrankia asymbiotica TaxID=1834516 RepID=A0A1V2IIS7_9ACTN|nr:hypothetical protein [Pseudofrankia asymbiotica]ONH32829.1 hypothetical protein BL253_03650 [Pseudofrankia asymbiotica]
MPRDDEVTVVTSGIDTTVADVSGTGPVVIWVLDHGRDIEAADPSAWLEGHHLRVTLPSADVPVAAGPPFSPIGPAELQSADVLVQPGGDGQDDLARCLRLLRSHPGRGVTAAGDVGRCVVVARYAQPLRIAADLPAPVVASAVHGWISSWWWARRRRPLAGLAARPLSIDYAGQRHPAAVTLAPSL